MSSPPGTSRQKKGIRQLLKESFRSRSRSPSQSLAQLDPGAPSVTTGSDEATAQTTSPARGVSVIDNAANITHQSEPPPVEPPGKISGSTIPIIVEPADAGPGVIQPVSDQRTSSRDDPTATSVQLNFVPSDLPESSNRAPEVPTIADDTYAEPGLALPSPGSVPPVNFTPDQVQRSWNVAWNGLRGSLRFLKDSSSVFPQLSSAVESLLSCLDGLEVIVQYRQDFESLATELTALSESLKEYTNGSLSVLVSSSTVSVAMAIERQAIAIKEQLAHASGGGIREANMNEEELVRHYRQIQSHFRQLQTNASMSTWSIANEHLVNTRLEGLSPAKQAAYDSSLSTQINRRGCTEGTRIGVLNGLDDWLYSSTSPLIYWMNGMAGTGKTTIASTFSERVERRKLLAASFFCTRSSAECRDVTRIVPTIAYQLARYSIPFRSALCKILGQDPDIGSKNVLKQFEQLLKEPLQQVRDALPDNLVVVIDALDECDDRNGVELMLDILFRYAAHVPLKFLLTSRPEPEIYSKMSTHAQSRDAIHLHDIEKSLVRADIELYLKEELVFMSPRASQAEIEQLVQRSGTLFIYAATLVRYIQSGKRLADPHKRLRSVLGLTPESTKKNTQIDALYTAVLKAALNEDELEADETEDIRVVLRTVLFAQEPIGVKTIAELAEIEDPERVMHALHPLRSVLHQSEETGLVSTLHASFPDFMFSNERSGIYFYDIVEHSQLLARRCFLVMKEQLRFNICDLGSSFIPDEEVEDIQERISANISPTLAYACRYWASHLALAPHSHTLLALLDEFLCHRLLFWMEVLSLRREMPMGVEGLLKVQQWLTHAEPSSSDLVLCVDEARSFVTSFAVNPTSRSTPHIYISSLPFFPHSSSVYKHYGKRSRGLLELKGSLMEAREARPLVAWDLRSSIQSFALSPDGTRIAIGGFEPIVRIMSVYDGSTLLGPLLGHTDSVDAVEFSPDGSRVVSVSRRGILVWDAYNGTLLVGPFRGVFLGHLLTVSFSPDGNRLVSAGQDCTVRLWDSREGTPLSEFDALAGRRGQIWCIKFSPSGSFIAAPCANHNIQLWNPLDGTLVGPSFKGHTGPVRCLAFTPDGTRLVSGSYDKTVRIWNLSDGSLVTGPLEGHRGSVQSVAVSPDGKRVASSSDYDLHIWDIHSGALVAGPFPGSSDLNTLAYSPDGTRVIYSSGNLIYVRVVRDGLFPPLSPPPPPPDVIIGIRCVSFRPDSTHFLTSGRSRTLRIWDATDGSFITPQHKAELIPSPFSTLSPDGSCAASTSETGTLQIISMTDGSLVAGPFQVEPDSLATLSFSRNNRAIIMGSPDGTIQVCDLQSGNTVVGSFVAHHKRVSSISESPDCSLLVSHSDYEMAIRVWNIVAPALDIPLSSTSIDPASGHSFAAVYDGWRIREDGWVVNNNNHLLFWLPRDLASPWCSPYATLAVTKRGTLLVPKQKLFIGEKWAQCYAPD